MSDYDIDKVSPRPWRIDNEGLIVSCDPATDLRTIGYHNGNCPHIVHCVNTHDALMDFARAVKRIDNDSDPGTWADIRKALDALRAAGMEI